MKKKKKIRLNNKKTWKLGQTIPPIYFMKRVEEACK